jgi:hypothetical protein
MELKLNLLLFLAENKLTRVSKTLIKKALQKRAYFNLAWPKQFRIFSYKQKLVILWI